MRKHLQRSAASAFPARCTVRHCSTKAMRCCGHAYCGNDTRSFREAAALDGDPQFRALTGNIVFPGFTAPKLAWVRENEPEIFARVRWVLLPKDYLRLWLTGEHMSEMSDSAGTSWLDTGKRKWSASLLAATHLEERQMPDLVEGTDAAGTLRPELAARWGMGPGVVVAGGAGDNAASACGMERSGRGRPSSRSALPACFSRPMQAISPTRRAPSTPSATRCPTPGTRWA